MENQNFEPKREERQNLKTKYKNQRLQQAKEIYLCECQKIYLSFPALYLHVKNKHKIKLTTKINDKICKMQEKNGKTYITYFLINEQEQQIRTQESNHSEEAKKYSGNSGIKTSNSEEEQKNYFKYEIQSMDDFQYWEGNFNEIPNSWIKCVIEQFLKEVTFPTLQLYQNFVKILSHFLNYIEICGRNSKQFEQLKNFQPESLISSLPLYFNEFICFYLPLYWRPETERQQEKHNQVSIMKFFGSWLIEKRYTTLMTLCDE